jgi:putative glutathione S-transferase
MGQMIDGEWHTDEEMLDHGDDGEFERAETTFREWVGGEPRTAADANGDESGDQTDEDVRFQPEAGRYHLYVSYACPWAHRVLTTRALLGLEEVITVDVVDPVREDQGWAFTSEKEKCTPDRVHGFDYLREVYAEADPEYTGRVTVPVLWDREEGTIVNNESEEIIKMLATAFDDLAERTADLYPYGSREEVDDLIDDIYPAINNGVYRAGFAGSQAAYERAVRELFDALEKYDRLLGEQRYLWGGALTLADICLYTTLFRFDEIYHTHFKCNVEEVADYEHLWPYLRELYQLPGVADVSHMDHCKQHYYRSHERLNPTGIVPVGPDPDFTAPHTRERLSGGPPADLTSDS